MEDSEDSSGPSKKFFEKLQDLDWGGVVYEYRVSVLLILIGLAVLGFGAFYLKAGDLVGTSDEIEVLEVTTQNQEADEDIYAEISGAVNKPGVYSFENGKRVEDLLVKAGGLSDDADTEWFERMINRAAKLSDGQKVYIPRRNEQSVVESANFSTGESAVSGVSTSQGSGSVKVVNINTATQKELEELWGIGPVYAQNIIDQRPYSTVKELLDRKIIKQNVYERNKDQMTVY